MSSEPIPEPVLNKLESRLLDRDAARVRDAVPIVDGLFSSLDSELASSSHYAGEVRTAFQELLLLTLRFLNARQNSSKEGLGKRLAYLFAPEAGKPLPLEEDLAQDYVDFLQSAYSGPQVHTEVRHIGGGRVDVLVTFGRFHFSAELKRELDDAGRESLRKYLAQEGLYEGTDVPLGFLLVLDLTEKPGPRTSFSLKRVAGTDVRWTGGRRTIHRCGPRTRQPEIAVADQVISLGTALRQTLDATTPQSSYNHASRVPCHGAFDRVQRGESSNNLHRFEADRYHAKKKREPIAWVPDRSLAQVLGSFSLGGCGSMRRGSRCLIRIEILLPNGAILIRTIASSARSSR